MIAVASDAFASTAAVLAVSAVVAFFAHRARQPLIVAFIVVGIVVGPSVLNWVNESEPLELFAQIGIAVLLFLVGLKLDIRLVRSTGKVALVTGLGQVVFTSVIGFLLALLLGMSAVTALYVAVALTFSSTIIIVKLLSDKRELDKLHGRIALGFLIVQDIVVVIAMIILSSLNSDRGGNVAVQILTIIATGLALLLGMWIVMKWFLPRVMTLVASSQELLIVSAVAWAVTIAALSDRVGFSVEVGAFLAGFALASTPYRESIASSLSGLRDFLLLFFFIQLGSQLDFSAIGAQVPAAIVLSLFVLIGNPIIVLILMGYMRYARRVSFLSGLAVAQISEFSLIFIALGFELGHIDKDAVGLVTLVGLVTIGTSTYMIIYSHQIFDRISPLLRIFERKDAIVDRPVPAEVFDVIVFGYGRFGRHVVNHLATLGFRVLVVDWDPYGRVHIEDPVVAEKVQMWFGDADDPEFPGTLPLEGVRWIVSTIARTDTNLVLTRSLRRWGATGKIAVTALSAHEVERLKVGVEEGHIDIVLQPFDDAADDAIRMIMGNSHDD
jgi:Kef-type K+ transport system membrane component KefB